ncbi:hypothetical protein F511_38633 [Dorcoceras hygrometricum]|uniref:MPN domain-containing protein n=1 Tax=Dorcoceras hygrometricum TaxID=472368 RepID=A0A2Z7BN83_9LAMI|nr:hypothetical protein F511_38633 [Dorcoceras hygrometricum]
MRREAFNLMTRKITVDNRISLRNYYRIADTLLKQANIYREEKNLIDLYVILLRYSSLVSETIPYHRDYQALCLKERTFYKKKLLDVLDELEQLKPQVRKWLDELDEVNTSAQVHHGPNKISYACSVNNKASLSYSNAQTLPVISEPSSSLKLNNMYTGVSSSNSIDSQFQKMSLSLPLPKQETLSRHSFLGPNGLLGPWMVPTSEIKVKYPTNIIVDSSEISSLNQGGRHHPVAVIVEDGDLKTETSTMDSVLSLDDGRWLRPTEESSHLLKNELERNDFQLGNIRQPSPPPVLAKVQSEMLPICPSKVADPRPGPPKFSQDGLPSSNSYQDLHIPVKMLEEFLSVARKNTAKNLETCGVLAGSLRNRVFQITTLIIPKQESTSDSCQTLNEEEIFEKYSIYILVLDLQTHPTQTCFMSSVDLHTHYSYQVCPYGIFHLSDPGGVTVIRNCQQRGFHPHEEPEDGSPIYEHCSHVYMNPNMKFEVIDLR